MRVLFPINEAMGLYKIGGLGDVGAGLPPVLRSLGADVRLALPHHPEITVLPSSSISAGTFYIGYDGDRLTVTVTQTFLPHTNVPVYLFHESRYLSEHTDASDNHADKYAVFCLAISHWLEQSQTWQPDVIHFHDWHTSLIPVLTRHLYGNLKYRYVATIHNLAYQGNTTTQVVPKLGLNQKDCDILSWDLEDSHLNILMEGLLHADAIVAVSPTYATEILTEAYGETLNEVLSTIKGKLVGILNGLDTTTFDPEADPYISTRYGIAHVETGKSQNKAALYQKFGWETPSNDALLIGFVGRVDAQQKGVQLIIEALRAGYLPNPGTRFVFLGTGDAALERQLHQAAHGMHEVHIVTRFDEPLARLIYAASDLMLIPSRYEPCGLVQLIAMRYGALPVARATGGLKDTIQDGVNGFLFDAYTTEAMMQSIDRAISLIRDASVFSTLRQQAMARQSDWTASAAQYLASYQSVLARS